MAKSKARRRSTKSDPKTPPASWGGHYSKKKRRTDRLVVGLVTALAVAGGGAYWWQARAGMRNFQAFAANGTAALADVKSSPSKGRVHLAPGQTWHYGSRFPTSGSHDPMWVAAGYYREPLRATQLVHALEHGNIVIYYDAPGAETRETLEQWAGLFSGRWDGVVVVSKAGLGEAVVLTAWTKTLRQPRFEPAGAAAFVEAYRGRGPENPVR